MKFAACATLEFAEWTDCRIGFTPGGNRSRIAQHPYILLSDALYTGGRVHLEFTNYTVL